MWILLAGVAMLEKSRNQSFQRVKLLVVLIPIVMFERPRDKIQHDDQKKVLRDNVFYEFVYLSATH